MKVGDLVKGTMGNLGIILWKEKFVFERWMVHWADGKRYAVNAENLWLVKP